VKYGKEYWLYYIAPILITFALGFAMGGADGLGKGIRVGIQAGKETGLKHCKEAGWAFIEEKVFPKKMIKESLFGEEYALEQLRYLQANIATKCITRFK